MELTGNAPFSYHSHPRPPSDQAGSRPIGFGGSECASGCVGGLRSRLGAAGVSVPALMRETDVGDATVVGELHICGCFRGLDEGFMSYKLLDSKGMGSETLTTL